ncbi:kinase RLK-Pelle-CrRLK1L-1 family protein, partial [Tanacetum coccineum]
MPEQTCQRSTLDEIQLATRNFDDALVIGCGGFGKVYKCLWKIGSAHQVAVKRLHSMSNQGAHEFEAEVKILSKLRHGNLVSLIGYCNEGKDMCLVYEFMPNGTLEDHLHKDDTELSWPERLKICIGAARGLDYLHTGTSTQHGVIHRDVKSPNILLDENFAAKISDFGLAKVCPINQTRTFVSTGVKGTFGYMDPYYFNSGKLTRKSDVYAFGVVLFEVLCGKQAVDPSLDEDQWSLAAWAQDQIKEGKLLYPCLRFHSSCSDANLVVPLLAIFQQIIDPRLMVQPSKKCLKEFTSVACRCLHEQPKQRPTMAEVVVKLDSILLQERESAEAGVDEGIFISRLKKATNYFSEKDYSTTVGGTIYKGWVDKRTYAPTESGIGLRMYVTKRLTEMSECMLINLVTLDVQLNLKAEEYNHLNLVKLLGYCLNEKELYCVYEHIPDPSLDKLLFGEPSGTSLSLLARLKIAVGVAHGLSFAHQRRHLAYTQFKTNCILVDMDYNARLWDFEVKNSFLAHDSYSFRKNAPYAAPKWFRYQADAIFDGLFFVSPYCNHEEDLGKIIDPPLQHDSFQTGMKVYDDNRTEGKQKLVKWDIPLLTDEEDLGKIIDPQLQHDSFLPKGAYKLASLVSKFLHPSQEKRPPMEEIYQTTEKGVGKEGFGCALNKSKGSHLGLRHCAANRKRKKRKGPFVWTKSKSRVVIEVGQTKAIDGQVCRHFSLAEIKSATRNFNKKLVIGRGGFGDVYKAKIKNGSIDASVAMKRLHLGSSQGAPEFWAEVEMLSKLRHCNLVSLIGYCHDELEMVLVYEYMQHGTLEDQLRRADKLSWLQRLRICIEAARGLDYLHTGTGT